MTENSDTPNYEALLDKLENEYAFACEAGPLKNCVDWQALRRAAARQQEALEQMEDKLAQEQISHCACQFDDGKLLSACKLHADLQEALAQCERRLLHIATSNADDWRWYQNQARQACRALGIKQEGLDWDAAMSQNGGTKGE